MRLLQLPAWLQAWGLDVELVDGWETRGVPFAAAPLVVLAHHTATSLDARGDMPTLDLLRRGRPDLKGPLCQVGLGRGGRVYVLASGKANHAGKGRWTGLPGGRDYDVRVSSRTVGIEAEHSGHDPWPQVQLDAYDRLAACLCWGLGQTAEAYCDHGEWALPAGRKVDVTFSMPAARLRVGRLLAAGPHRPVAAADAPPLPRPAPPPLAHLEDDMARLITHDGSTVYTTNGLARRWVRSRAELGDLVRVGAVDSDQVQRVSEATVDALVLVGPESPGAK